MTFDRVLDSLARSRALLCRTTAAVGLTLGLAGAAQAQLVVTGMPDTPDPVAAGGVVTYNVGIGDALGVARSGVTVNFDVPATGRYAGTGALPAGVSCGGMAVGQAGPGTVSCTGVSVPTQDVVHLPMRVRSIAAGTMTVTASVVGGSSQT